MTGAAQRLWLVANARLPSQRAQSLQVAQVAGAFARQGLETTLVHALRRDTAVVDDLRELWDYYGLPRGARPGLRSIANVDWIDVVPRRFQYLPARVQELTFARNAARHVGDEGLVLCRELECARRLVQGGRENVFLEVHRVPGGKLRRRWLLEACAGLAGVIAISGGVREDLEQLGVPPALLTVAHDGYEAERFSNAPTRADARRELDLEPGEQVVIYTGGLLAWKGVDVLVDAARCAPCARFVIAGGMDADVAQLKAHAAGLANVRFEGFQAPERVALYLAAADIGVVPNRSKPAISARYTSPLKVFEAKAVGLPLVVSDLYSMRDVLSESEALFVEPDSPEALAAGIEQLLADEALRGRMSRELLAKASDHTWDARARRLMGWMEQQSRTQAGSAP